jgi:hypothetical protein
MKLREAALGILTGSDPESETLIVVPGEMTRDIQLKLGCSGSRQSAAAVIVYSI